MIDPSSEAEVAPALLAYLETRAGFPGARLGSPPRRIFGGNQTFVHGLEIEGAAGLEGPLILRIVRPFIPADSVVREAALQNALHEAGYPVARVAHVCSDPTVLGGAFQIMERLRGAPIVHADADSEGTIGLRDALASFGAFVFGAWPTQLADLHQRLHAIALAPLLAACEKAGLSRDALSFEAALERLAERAGCNGAASEHTGRGCTDPAHTAGLGEAFAWLRANPPPAFVDPARRVLCHGDFFPNQVLGERGAITGVIDWSDFCIAPPELDVAIVKTGIETVPVPFGPLGRRIVAARARHFFDAYRARASLDPQALRYVEVFRCTHSLLGVAERRRALAEDAGRANPNPYDSERTVAELVRRIQQIAGCHVELPR